MGPGLAKLEANGGILRAVVLSRFKRRDYVRLLPRFKGSQNPPACDGFTFSTGQANPRPPSSILLPRNLDVGAPHLCRDDIFYDCRLVPDQCRHTDGVLCNTYRYCTPDLCLIDDASNSALARSQCDRGLACGIHTCGRQSMAKSMPACPQTRFQLACQTTEIVLYIVYIHLLVQGHIYTYMHADILIC